jgi:hypothetical protein
MGFRPVDYLNARSLDFFDVSEIRQEEEQVGTDRPETRKVRMIFHELAKMDGIHARPFAFNPMACGRQNGARLNASAAARIALMWMYGPGMPPSLSYTSRFSGSYACRTKQRGSCRNRGCRDRTMSIHRELLAAHHTCGALVDSDRIGSTSAQARAAPCTRLRRRRVRPAESRKN